MRVAMGVEYDGTRFFGWQTQAREPTVQSVLERALSRVANEPVRVFGAGRTDTGVHARGQTFHFDSGAERSRRSWILGTNSNLPEDVAVIWAKSMPADFDARASALGRRYRYAIVNRWVRPVLARAQALWVRRPLAEEAMHSAAQALVGEHDFTSFRALACQARHARRRLTAVAVARAGDSVEITVEGNAFLHHMVRNIVGTLLEVGLGRRPPEWVAEVLSMRDRSAAGVTAPAHGLCLDAVRYPARYGIPGGPMAEGDA